MHDISDKTCLLAIQGPNATKLLQPLTEMEISNLKYYTFVKGKFAGVDNVLVSATGYTGAGGVEIYFEDTNDAANIIWDKLMELNIKPIGLGARDTLRLEMGYCLYGNDIDDTTSPLEAGLGWITKFSKEFNSKLFIEVQKIQGVKRRLVGFEMIERGIPRHDYLIKDEAGNTIGKVTSGTQIPGLNKAVGLGYVANDHANIGSTIYIDIRNTLVKAIVAKTPFV
jgi:aminomethyltransferase